MAGRLPHCVFRGLLGVHSRYGLHTRRITFHDPLHRSAPVASLPPRLLRLLPAGAKVAGRGLNPLKDRAFSRRTFTSSFRRFSDCKHSSSTLSPHGSLPYSRPSLKNSDPHASNSSSDASSRLPVISRRPCSPSTFAIIGPHTIKFLRMPRGHGSGYAGNGFG